jgi:hypothetical protein
MQLAAAYQAIPLGTRGHLESLASDIRFVTRELDRKNLKWFFFLLAARAAGKTVATKVTAFRHIAGYTIKAGAKAVGFGKDTARRYLQGDVRDVFSQDLDRMKVTARTAAASLSERARKGWTEFSMMTVTEQREELALWVLSLLVFFGVAGGRDLEGGFPDSDIRLLGIGGHRNIFFHSVLAGMGLEFGIRFLGFFLKKCYELLPEKHHPLWNKLHGFGDRITAHAIFGAWVGVGAHLVKDAAVFSDAIKPISGLPVSIPNGRTSGPTSRERHGSRNHRL